MGAKAIFLPNRFGQIRLAPPYLVRRDILGNQYGGESGKDYSQVTIDSWTQVGNYAFRFQFSDGHNTGIFSYDLLRQLAGE